MNKGYGLVCLWYGEQLAEPRKQALKPPQFSLSLSLTRELTPKGGPARRIIEVLFQDMNECLIQHTGGRRTIKD